MLDRPIEERPLLDKLGVKPGMRVVVLGLSEPWFEAQLRSRTEDVHDRPVKGCDLIFMAAGSGADLLELGSLRGHLKDAGAIWVVRRKGEGRTLREVDVIDAARAAGLVDNKIASLSAELGAMRLVIPLSQRGSR